MCRFFIGPTIGSILGAVNGAAAAMVSMVVSLLLIAVALPETCRPKPEALQGESVVFAVPPCQFAVFYPYASLLRPVCCVQAMAFPVGAVCGAVVMVC